MAQLFNFQCCQFQKSTSIGWGDGVKGCGNSVLEVYFGVTLRLSAEPMNPSTLKMNTSLSSSLFLLFLSFPSLHFSSLPFPFLSFPFLLFIFFLFLSLSSPLFFFYSCSLTTSLLFSSLLFSSHYFSSLLFSSFWWRAISFQMHFNSLL